MPSPSPLTAAAYIRVSTEDQAEFSPDAQRKAILRWASSNGYAVDPQYIFVDEGISGRRAEKRPAFMAMIAAAKGKNHPFDAILVHKFDRFARSREDSVVYKSLLKKEYGVRVISITESIEDDKFSIILEAMLEAMAEYYSVNLSEEVKKGMTEKAHRGGLQSAPPFGYRAEQNALVPVPEEAALVQELFRRYVAGEGCYPLARWLNDQGVRTKRGNPFDNRAVSYILQNPVYVGKLRWNPSGRTRRDFQNEHIILADARHQPLVDQDTFQAAQLQFARDRAKWRPHSRPSFDRKDWLSGLVRCASCGSTLIFQKPHYFKCGAYAKGQCKTSQWVSIDALHDAVIRGLQYDADSMRPLPVEVKYASGSTEDRASVLTRQVQLLRRRLARLREAYLAGVDTLEEYKAAKQTVESDLAEQESALAQQQAAPPQEDTDTLMRRRIAATLHVLRDPAATMEEKYTALASIVAHCTWNKATNTLKILYCLTM